MCSAWWGWWPGYSPASARPPSDSSSDGRQANKTKPKRGHFRGWQPRHPHFKRIWTHHCSSVCAGCWLKWSKPSHRNTQLQSWKWLRVNANIGLERTDTSCIIHWLQKQFDADFFFFFYTAPSSTTCCRDEYKAENKVMCDVKPAFGWINSWKIRPKCQEKKRANLQEATRRPRLPEQSHIFVFGFGKQ